MFIYRFIDDSLSASLITYIEEWTINYARVSGVEGAKVMAGMSNDKCQM